MGARLATSPGRCPRPPGSPVSPTRLRAALAPRAKDLPHPSAALHTPWVFERMFEHMLRPAGIRAAREQEQFSRDQERLAEAQVRAKRLPGLCVWRVEGQPPESWSLTQPRPAQPSPVKDFLQRLSPPVPLLGDLPHCAGCRRARHRALAGRRFLTPICTQVRSSGLGAALILPAPPPAHPASLHACPRCPTPPTPTSWSCTAWPWPGKTPSRQLTHGKQQGLPLQRCGAGRGRGGQGRQAVVLRGTSSRPPGNRKLLDFTKPRVDTVM